MVVCYGRDLVPKGRSGEDGQNEHVNPVGAKATKTGGGKARTGQ